MINDSTSCSSFVFFHSRWIFRNVIIISKISLIDCWTFNEQSIIKDLLPKLHSISKSWKKGRTKASLPRPAGKKKTRQRSPRSAYLPPTPRSRKTRLERRVASVSLARSNELLALANANSRLAAITKKANALNRIEVCTWPGKRVDYITVTLLAFRRLRNSRSLERADGFDSSYCGFQQSTHWRIAWESGRSALNN